MSRASIEAARTIWEHLNSAVATRETLTLPRDIERVEILTPPRTLEDTGNAALVIHLTDGSRWGMEVCPVPQLPRQLGAVDGG